MNVMKLMIDVQQVHQVICSYHTYENIVHDPNINTYIYAPTFWTLEIFRIRVETPG